MIGRMTNAFDENELAIYGLLHDIEEACTGDIPFLMRNRLPNALLSKFKAMAAAELDIPIGDIPERIRPIIDFADAFELKLYLEEERLSGNLHLYDIERETYRRLLDAELPNGVKSYFLEWIEPLEPKAYHASMTHEGEQWQVQRNSKRGSHK